MMRLLKRLWPAEQAEALSEYVLLAILISLATLATINGLASAIGHFYSDTSSHVVAVTGHQSINTEPMPDDNTIQTKHPSHSEDNDSHPN